MARNPARMASDFWSWYHSMKAFRKATAMRIPPRYSFGLLSCWEKGEGGSRGRVRY